MLGFQWLSTFFVSSENNLKKVLDGDVGERYTWCIEGQESQAAQLLAAPPSSNTLGLRASRSTLWERPLVGTMKRFNKRGLLEHHTNEWMHPD